MRTRRVLCSHVLVAAENSGGRLRPPPPLPNPRPQAIANKDNYSICSINLSIGDGRKNSELCPGSVYEVAFATARAAGILPVVSSGNNYYQNGLSDPACAPSAVSVGAVHDADNGAFDSCDTVGRALRGLVTCVVCARRLQAVSRARPSTHWHALAAGGRPHES
jgi:hypothetical protein